MSGETVYSRAADHIRERGWFKAGDEPDSQRACIAIAVEEAASDEQEEVEALTSLASHLDLDHESAGLWLAIPRWNDAPERTVEDVLMVLKELHVEAGES